jgi:hypothetical protein
VLGYFALAGFESLGESWMPTRQKQRERAGSLYLMASDAFGRGDQKIAEVLVTLANRYADLAAGLQSEDDQHLTPATVGDVRDD